MYEAQLKLTYDFDVWGKRRNAFCAALGEIQANVADAAFARLQLSINVAQVYFLLQIDYKLRQVARALVVNREAYLNLIQQSVQDNVDNALTLHSAETNLAVARQALLQIEGEIEVYQYQLKTYLAEDFQEAIYPINIDDTPFSHIPLPANFRSILLAIGPILWRSCGSLNRRERKLQLLRQGFIPISIFQRYLDFKPSIFGSYLHGRVRITMLALL